MHSHLISDHIDVFPKVINLTLFDVRRCTRLLIASHFPKTISTRFRLYWPHINVIYVNLYQYACRPRGTKKSNSKHVQELKSNYPKHGEKHTEQRNGNNRYRVGQCSELVSELPE